MQISWHVLLYNAVEYKSLPFKVITADCVVKHIGTSCSIRLPYYSHNHYCTDCQGVKYVGTNIPAKGSTAKFLCSGIIVRGVGTGGLRCVCMCMACVGVCVWHVCVSACVLCVCVCCVCVCVWCVSGMCVCVLCIRKGRNDGR